jgi:hypothetical protein
MSASSWVFPTGATLTIGGVVLCSLDEWQHWDLMIPPGIFLPLLLLLLGTPLAVIGSFLDRKRLSVAQVRARGKVCWAVSGVSLLLLIATGNVHRWTFTYVFPTFAGFVAGVVLLSKVLESEA